MQPYSKKWLVAYGLLFVVVGFLVFYRLDKFSLWQDEADLALLSQSVLQTGFPVALIDSKFITQWAGRESTKNYLWFMDPWPLFYLRAASFKIFGISEWSARFPCAFLGWLSLVPIGLLVRRWTKSHAITFLTLFFFGTNPWVILYMRQSKYWPIVFFSFSILLLGYQKWENSKKGWPLFALGLIILFHSNYFTAALSLLGLGAYTLFFAKWEKARFRFFFTTGITLILLCLPFFLIGAFEDRVFAMSTFPTLLQYFKKLGTHIFYFNRQICPLILLLLWIYWWVKNKWSVVDRSTLLLVACSILFAWLGIALLNFDVLRFNLQLIPLFCFLMAATLVQIYQKNKLAGAFLFGIFWATNLLQADSFDLKKMAFKEEWLALKNYYFIEYQDPAKILPQLMKTHWKPGEYVYLNHNQPVWQYHSDIPLAYLVRPEEIAPKEPPLAQHYVDKSSIDWWIGPHLVKMARGPHLTREEMIQEWNRTGYDHEVIDTKIPVLNWDLNSPIRYKHFLKKFGERDENEETIKLLHRIKKS
ncbi:MAG: hypothetical protein A3F82_01145 [Deltaproteobacteria bacterium RIFCSPLOWO2_12_FULL_44_12]|nr:MAG: hypothetical protein A2712_03810 [Deltaproteobacteria bacterium RIFCSPHIGHO2_01_FULL_43_49]OGQ16313.1 MAG: hypothetical protein A3D22_01780 [Deltaproteobacteria bacterium RIFCSPHIGHO2_02_FULL_44_53]OGQ29273.1 MAG: hypothetical protein A3D98_05565 [Deltaproteobacteria bacterium RIFCSPHIGHO2_12_FULL_44_21]OGQ32830.1 MAG: hypothetical protein A2979_09710 [Deltaproteobacteria bacterium RIFCSPLOWO2_01_FULL_45_74]OGQ41931.1 MAG: hypothetical protein A3I70_09495 [Deltaproteobacteria bacterium 